MREDGLEAGDLIGLMSVTVAVERLIFNTRKHDDENSVPRS